MPTLIPVTRSFSVRPLVEINDPDFAHWYELGVFWAMYGDYQGNGPYEDRYLIENISRNLAAGRYDSISSSWFSSVGFYLGMLHGGMLEPGSHQMRQADTIVVLTDLDFTAGYEQRHRTPQPLTDFLFMQTLHQFAVQHVMGQALAYELGRMAGTLSHALKPAIMPATSR